MTGQSTAREYSDSLPRELDDILQAEMRLAERFTRGDLAAQTLQNRASALRRRRLAIDEELDRRALPTRLVQANVARILALAARLWDLYQPLDDRKRGDLLQVVFRTVIVGPEGVLGFTLSPPFDRFCGSTTLDVGAAAASLVEGSGTTP